MPSPPEILTVFPELTLEDVPTALLQTAELMKDPEAQTMELPVAETRAYRRVKARKGA